MTKSCLAPHEIQTGDLVAYLEGMAPPQVVQHIDQCPACSHEVETLRQIDSLLAGAFAQARSAGVEPSAGHANGFEFKAQYKPPDFNERRAESVRQPRAIKINFIRSFAGRLSAYFQRNQLVQTMRGRQTSSSRRMILAAFVQLLVLFGLLSGVYYLFQYLSGRPVDVPPQALETRVIIASKTVEMNQPLSDDAASINDNVSATDEDTSQEAKGIIEKVSAIAPPRPILKMIEKSLAGTDHLLVYYLEETSAIMPPRELLNILEEELNAQRHRSLSSWWDYPEPHWSESIILAPDKGETYLVRLSIQHHISTISFAHSTDDGQTWSEEVPIHRKRSSLFNPSLAADAQGNLYVVWREGRNLGANIYFARSTDSGQTWSRGIRLNSEPGQNFKPSLAVSNEGALYITWQNPRNNDTNIYFIHSTDGGQTWKPEVRIAKVGS